MHYTTRDMTVGSDGKLRPLNEEEVTHYNQQRRQIEEMQRQLKPIVEDEAKKERELIEKRIRKEPIATHKAFYNSYLSLLTHCTPEAAYDKAIASVALLRRKGAVT